MVPCAKADCIEAGEIRGRRRRQATRALIDLSARIRARQSSNIARNVLFSPDILTPPSFFDASHIAAAREKHVAMPEISSCYLQRGGTATFPGHRLLDMKSSVPLHAD